MKTKSLVRTAVLTAIVFVSMSVMHFEIGNSAFHLGSMVIVIISLIFPRKEAVLSSAIGATLFDLFTGYVIYAPFTFVARFLLSLIVSFSANKNIHIQIFFTILGSLAVVAVYFVSYVIFTDSLSVAKTYSTADFLQLLIAIPGVFIAIPLKKIVKIED